MLEYKCNICHYKTTRKDCYTKHLETNKHSIMDQKDKETTDFFQLLVEGMHHLEDANKEIANLRIQIMLRDIEIKELKNKIS